MVRYPFLMQATYYVRCAHRVVDDLFHEIMGKLGARKAKHRVASPFVDDEYALKRKNKQHQFLLPALAVSHAFSATPPPASHLLSFLGAGLMSWNPSRSRSFAA